MAYTSQYVLDEISKATPLKYKMMKCLVDKYVQNTLIFDTNVLTLADVYIKNVIIPDKYVIDARHIAVATGTRLILWSAITWAT